MSTILDHLSQGDFSNPVPVSELWARGFVQVSESTSNFRWFAQDNAPVPLPALQKFLLGLPGVTIIALNTLGNPSELLSAARNNSSPVLFVEHKQLYPCSLLEHGRGDLLNWQVESDLSRFPTFTLHSEYPPALTIATYGYNFELARAAALDLMMAHEIFSEIVLFSQLSPVEFAPLAASLASTRRLVTVEDGSLAFGWGAELIACAAALDIRRLKTRRVAVRHDELPNLACGNIVTAVLEILGQKYLSKPSESP